MSLRATGEPALRVSAEAATLPAPDGCGRRLGVALLGALLAGSACEPAPPAPTPDLQPVEEAAPDYVGVAVCQRCHAEETRLWRGSHHDLAMQEASAETVLGDFSGSLEHHGERFEFAAREGRFLVRAPGPDGEPREFEVAYTFGVEPLQQYLVPLEGGRLQALGVAWDVRPATAGGQRWFHLYPGEAVPPGDVLHWTGAAASWNARCADCHSTNLEKAYDASEDRYRTTWSEADVSCEACHGPGSAHVAWAESGGRADGGLGLVVDLRAERTWRFEGGSAIARRVPPEAPPTELDTCAPCHSRRARIAAGDPGGRFLDAFRPALLEEGLYHADGQILDEVYVWGSFLQSKMHAAGVVCSDCHDPHSLRIEEPDAVCARCHESAVFAAPAHHHHGAGSPGASCVACHMPARTYMVVDERRDHSFRVPRPDLSVAIGVPNACSSCHDDEPASWAAEAVERWDPRRSDRTHYGEVLYAGRRRAPGAALELASLGRDTGAPAIVRASALELLGSQLDPGSVASVLEGLRDGSDLVRMAAVRAAEALPPPERRSAVAPLLRDPVRAVRIEAGRALAPWQPQVRDPAAARALADALAEYRAAQALEADRPESHVNLGILHGELGELTAAEQEYRTALRQSPFFVPAYVNLAELYRVRQRDQDGERILREGLTRVPESGALHHALGLLLVRRGQGEQALQALREAVRLDPESTRFAYVYGVALHSAGQGPAALEVLAAAHHREPGDADVLVALATLHRDAGERDAALRYARRLLELRPEDPGTQQLVRGLEAQQP